MSRLEKFLGVLERRFPDAKTAWKTALYEISQERCGVVVDGICCNLKNINGLCPYHMGSEIDFLRRCTYLTDRGSCGGSVSSRDPNTVWCEKHLLPQRPSIHIRRVGDYIVIRGTPFAISDDMRHIIGRVEATYLLSFMLRKEVDPFMEETALLYGLGIQLDEE